jgi:hypothetical protein
MPAMMYCKCEDGAHMKFRDAKKVMGKSMTPKDVYCHVEKEDDEYKACLNRGGMPVFMGLHPV